MIYRSAESSKATNHEGLVVTLFKRGEQSAAVIRAEMPLKGALVAALPPLHWLENVRSQVM